MQTLFWIWVALLVAKTAGQCLVNATFRACPNATIHLAEWPNCANNPANRTCINIDVMQVSAWTYNSVGCPTGKHRIFLKFYAMDTIPADAVVQSATLKLFGVGYDPRYPQGSFTTYPGSVFNSFGPNTVLVTRTVTTWDPVRVTWLTQPTVGSESAVIPASNVQHFYNPKVNVTALVRQMVQFRNFQGFRLALETEVYYRQMVFYAAGTRDSTLWPLLEISYSVPCPK